MTNTPLTHPITEDDIADYLGNTPDFFERHAELLAAVHLVSPHSQRAVSLQERQAEMLREKIKVLEHRLMDMMRHGNENVLLSDKLLRWARGLFAQVNLADLPRQMVAEIAEQFAVPQAGIKVWGVAPQFAQEPYALGVSEDAKLFATSLLEPFCGVNTGFEAISWLPEPQGVASLAILPLRAGVLSQPSPAFGMLVLASPDPQRFSSTMATDFLARMSELASASLARLC